MDGGGVGQTALGDCCDSRDDDSGGDYSMQTRGRVIQREGMWILKQAGLQADALIPGWAAVRTAQAIVCGTQRQEGRKAGG